MQGEQIKKVSDGKKSLAKLQQLLERKLMQVAKWQGHSSFLEKRVKLFDQKLREIQRSDRKLLKNTILQLKEQIRKKKILIVKLSKNIKSSFQLHQHHQIFVPTESNIQNQLHSKLREKEHRLQEVLQVFKNQSVESRRVQDWSVRSLKDKGQPQDEQDLKAKIKLLQQRLVSIQNKEKNIERKQRRIELVSSQLQKLFQ